MSSLQHLQTQIAPVVLSLTGSAPTSIEALAGGASLRRYYRIRTAEPAFGSLLLMELPEIQMSDEAVHTTAITELPFINIQRYLETGEIAVPQIYQYDAAFGHLYLEDLGDITLEHLAARAAEPELLAYYRAAVDALVKMQNFTDSYQDPTCLAFYRQFDYQLLRWELNHFVEYGLTALGMQLSPSESQLMADQFDRLARLLDGMPKHFVHRDFQSRNLMMQSGRDGQVIVRIIDFQDALLGTQAYDLVGLLRDSYIELRKPTFESLLQYYRQLRGLGSDFTELFYLQTVQRKLKDIGRFVYIEKVKQLPGYLNHISGSLRYVQDALLQLPTFAPLLELFAKAKIA